MGYENTITSDSFATLRETSPEGTVCPESLAVFVQGRSAAGDGYGGLFYWDAGGAGADDNLDTIRSNVAVGVWRRSPLMTGRGIQTVTSSGGVRLCGRFSG